jgi:peptide deformylase
MAVLNILRYPDPRLYKVAKPVERVDDEVRRLVSDMAQTMYSAPGIGLAATQVDVHKQIIVIDVSDTRDQLIALINPEIVWHSDQDRDHEEGCLSVPGIYETVRRPERIKVRALNADGEAFELEAEGLLAVCVQHEMDHLRGKVFVDYLSRLKQSRIRAKLQKQLRQTA